MIAKHKYRIGRWKASGVTLPSLSKVTSANHTKLHILSGDKISSEFVTMNDLGS
jgi:hypothetical protein